MFASVWPYRVVRWALATVFVYAGGNKLTDIEAFAEDIGVFGLVRESVLPAVAVGLPVVEIVAGMGLLWRGWDDSKTGGTTTDYQGLLGPDKTRLIVVYCGLSTCARSHNAARFARELGYWNVSRYVGGIYAWKGAGHTTEVAEEHRNLASVSCSHHPH